MRASVAKLFVCLVNNQKIGNRINDSYLYIYLFTKANMTQTTLPSTNVTCSGIVQLVANNFQCWQSGFFCDMNITENFGKSLKFRMDVQDVINKMCKNSLRITACYTCVQFSFIELTMFSYIMFWVFLLDLLYCKTNS